MFEILMYAGLTLAILSFALAAFFFIKNRVPDAISYFIKMKDKDLFQAENVHVDSDQATEVLNETGDVATAVLADDHTVVLDELEK